jgi:hypothetical protein
MPHSTVVPIVLERVPFKFSNLAKTQPVRPNFPTFVSNTFTAGYPNEIV